MQTNWRKFSRAWKNYEIASNLINETSQFRCAVLLTVIGEDAMDKFDGFKFDARENDNDIETVMRKFEEFCMGTTHEAFESYRFHSRAQEQNETIEAYVAELRKLARGCNFENFEDRMIRDRILVGCKSDHVREKLLENPKLTLKKAIEIARAYEASQVKLTEMRDLAVDRISSHHKKKTQTAERKYVPNEKKKFGQKKKCTRCGYDIHQAKECPAMKAECNKCKKVGHFASQCRTREVKEIEAEEVTILGAVYEVNNIDDWSTEVLVNQKRMKFYVDTGADVTVIPDRCFKDTKVLKPTDKKLCGAGGSKLEVLGVYKAILEKNEHRTDQDLYVIKGLKKPLLGKPAIKELKILEFVNELSKTELNPRTDFPELFRGLGEMKNTYKIELKDDAKPFNLTCPRRLPLPLKDKVEEELKSLQEQGIIRPIDKPTDWCAPIVAVMKATGKVRLCCDFSKLNEAVKRELYPLPTTDQLLAQIDGANFFSKLDCNKGFHQIALDQDSQELTTFITPFGRFCYQRLPFGINSGPEIFHREMSKIISGIPGVISDIDDVLVSGKDKEEHDYRLKQVLNKMADARITLNEKCEFAVPQVKFLGHIISKKGIRIDPDKVEAITKLEAPKDVPGLRRLLGMVNHVGKFIPMLAELTKPLRDMLKRDNEWMWGADQETAFQKVKEILISAPVLDHYNANKPTKISADASSYGIGGVLMQKSKDHWKPIFYASRSLTDAESRYAQIEKEALAMTWICERFSEFLVGLPRFEIETDHKPLLSIMKSKDLDLLTTRLQRFRMRMLRFTYDIQYVPGKDLTTADTLSRAPLTQNEANTEIVDEEVLLINRVFDSLPITDKRLEEVRAAQQLDSECQRIMAFCIQDHWPQNANKVYKGFYPERHCLSVERGTLLHGTRLVIPSSLRSDMLQRIHQGHQGIVKTRALAKTCIWWPGISKEIEKLVTNCPECEKHRVLPPQPLKPTPTPEHPWERVGSDLFEWNGEHYILVVDYYSRWIEISHLMSLSSRNVINSFKAIFARMGIPKLVCTDNGTQYTAKEFTEFAEYFGFEHIKSSPHHQSANGEAERAVRTIKNMLKKEQDPFLALLNYRATPLEQGKSPAELLMNRKIRTRIPALPGKKTDVEFRARDTWIKNRMKRNFDQRHKTKTLPEFHPGQPVWIKTPKYEEATTIPRSIDIQTKSGFITRRNRQHLRKRTEGPTQIPQGIPTETNLPTLGKTKVETDVPLDIEDKRPATVVTRSGRLVKPREILDL